MSVTHKQYVVTRHAVEIELPDSPPLDSDAWDLTINGHVRLSLREVDFLQLINVLIHAWNVGCPDNQIRTGGAE